jgi:hypothetical protein
LPVTVVVEVVASVIAGLLEAVLYVSPAIHRGCAREVFSSEIIHPGPLPDLDVVVTV